MATRRKPSYPIATPGDPFLLYTTEDGRTRLEVHLENETVWLSLNQMDDFLKLSDRDILTHTGRISREEAEVKAEAEFEKFSAMEKQKPSPAELDFQKALEQVKQLGIVGK